MLLLCNHDSDASLPIRQTCFSKTHKGNKYNEKDLINVAEQVHLLASVKH